jgi:hypothetical protein
MIIICSGESGKERKKKREREKEGGREGEELRLQRSLSSMIVPGVIVNDIRLFNIVKLRFH